jgi:hypothetical protein
MKKLLFLIVLPFFFVACENSVTLKTNDEIQQPDNNEQPDEEIQDEAVDETVLDEETPDTEQPDEMEDETLVDSDIVWDNCSENYDCKVGEMCQKKTGDCEGWGHCEKVPEACDDVFEPVCGCDDVTFSNICEANKLSRNAKHSGECE